MSLVRSKSKFKCNIAAGGSIVDGVEARTNHSAEFDVGTVVDDGHWAVLQNPHRFEPVEEDAAAARRRDYLGGQSLLEYAQRTGQVENGERSRSNEVPEHLRERPAAGTWPVRDQARRAVDALRGRVPDDGVERLTRGFERAEASPYDAELNLLSRWMVATSRPAYNRAVNRMFRDPENGHREFDTEELDAFRAAKAVQRAMSIGTGADGGFLLPTHLDPAIVLSSAGSVDPMRSLARVETIATNEWHGITSAGVTASWAAEAAEATDDSPTVADPSVPTVKAHAFLAASIEAAQDTNIAAQIQMLFADAKAQLEAGGFVTGSGTDEPNGVVTALAGGASEVSTAGVAAYAREDVLALQESIPARFRNQRSAFMMALEVLNATREFPKIDGGVDVSLVDDSSNPPRVRGWGLHENSSLDATFTTGSNIAVAGDFRQGYLIVDRVGATVEFLPHLLGANRRPTGSRGWYMFWRTGGDVLVENALRLLTVA